ncbi:MAG: CBS domain-containing protein [Deltaproteobacteria bacterium]|nr:CBS domain-containing protein [Deltaproteobacteria bacterium]
MQDAPCITLSMMKRYFPGGRPAAMAGVMEKRVSDLILDVNQVAWIEPQTPILEAVRKLRQQLAAGGPGFLLVVNQDEILGTISLTDVLLHIEPPASLAEDIPIFWQGQFEDLTKKFLGQPVAEAVQPLSHALNQGGTLMEALHLMNSKGVELVIAMQGGQVAGLLSRDRLLQEILGLVDELA